MASDLYCICRKPYDHFQFMIQCDACDDWFHGSCVGVQEFQANDIERYHCPRCTPKYGPLTLKKQQNFHRHDYSDVNAHCKAVQAGTVVFIKQLKSKQFSSPENILVKCQGKELTLDFLSKRGFRKPILVESKAGLGLVVPKSSFSIADVQQNIGSYFELDIIDVARQGDMKMKMCDWTAYFMNQRRQKTLNVISLEFSKTSLSHLVHGPKIVREIDWVNRFWPEHGTDDSASHPKPCVQKYCLMGVKNSYTDFHIDFGGSSVWYHVLWGEKCFYFAEPTETNLNLYEKWVASSNQSEMFFADLITRCYKVCVKPGQTLFIPSGWIHAVYTSQDSLVFGGNFLHSYNIGLQLNIYDMELRVKTPVKYLFSSFETVHWHAAAGLVDDLKNLDDSGEKIPQFLIDGIHALLDKLKSWVSKKCVTLDQHKMFLPEGMDYNKVIRALSKELKQAEKPSVVVHEQKPVIKIKNPNPAPSISKKPESRKRSEKSDSRNQRKRILPSEKAPLKLKISKNKEAELSTDTTSENLKLVLSNGKIVSGNRKKQSPQALEVAKDSSDDEDSRSSSYSCQPSQEQPLRMTLSAANGRGDSDDDVNVDDDFPAFPASNGFPTKQQFQALYSSRGETTATTSKTFTSRHHPPVSIALPTSSSDEHSPEKFTSVDNSRRRSRLNSPADDEDELLNTFPSDPDYVYPTIEDDEIPGKVKWKPGMKKKKSERVDATWNPKGRVAHSQVKTNPRPVRQISRKPEHELPKSPTNNNVKEIKSPKTSLDSEGSSSKHSRAPLRPSGASNQPESEKGNASKRGRRPVHLTTKQRLAKKLKLDRGGMFMR